MGPTASGKSDVAQHIAERQGFAILSADSMAVYRGMDVGTAKPTAAQRARVRYYGLDLAGPDCRFSVWDFRGYAQAILAGSACPVIVVGGTGLYIKSLTHGLAAGGGADDRLRALWRERVAAEGLAPLAEAARAADPAGYAVLGGAVTARRLVRLIERSAGDGARGTRWAAADSAAAPLAGICRDRDDAPKRIAQRVHAMYRGGLIEEVRSLRDTGVAMSETARAAIGYAEAWAAIEGRCTVDAAMERTIVRTRQLAKRQRTWFRTQASVAWFTWTASESVGTVAERILEYWRVHGPTRIAEFAGDAGAAPERPV